MMVSAIFLSKSLGNAVASLGSEWFPFLLPLDLMLCLLDEFSSFFYVYEICSYVVDSLFLLGSGAVMA
jgi:hypothetical protein